MDELLESEYQSVNPFEKAEIKHGDHTKIKYHQDFKSEAWK